jgi:hypothetical protein
MQDILFTDVHILDCTGKNPYLGEVLLKGNRITRVDVGRNAVPRSGCRVIEGAGLS